MNSAHNMDVANEILRQLGGGRFVAMTGARQVSGGSNYLTFKLPRRFARHGITAVRVVLDASDTYTVTFFRQAPAPTFRVDTVKEVSDVYADSLQSLFTSVTGLDTHL